MTVDPQKLRLEGIYPQRQKDFFMQRIKLPAGVISSVQALKVAEIADRFARGRLHLTTRGSIELHWLTAEDLPVVAREMASVGLISRGACGGAVRGVVCGSLGVAGAPRLEAVVRLIHRHFSGNPRFETLPKKFKVAVEADTTGGRHLIQDLSLIPVDLAAERLTFNVWVAGGLGREPTPAFLLEENLPLERVVGLVEAVVRVYTAHTPAGKRLKHLVREIGREEFRARVMADPSAHEELPTVPSLSSSLVSRLVSPDHRIEVGIFAGELAGSELAALADIGAKWGGGILLVTGEQNIVLHIDQRADQELVRQELVYAGFPGTGRRERVAIRVCPGSHECLVGLGPTRDIAASLADAMGPAALKLQWAISGCPNSCAQPQLADAGVIVSRLQPGDGGEKEPLFDLYRRSGPGFGERVAERLTLAELLAQAESIGGVQV